MRINVKFRLVQRGYSSFGRARPCQGRGDRFEPGYPLQEEKKGVLISLIDSSSLFLVLKWFKNGFIILPDYKVVWQGGSVVRRGIANPLFASSILAPASNFNLSNLAKVGSECRDGGTGRRKGLKIPRK